ncbi:hypothetical protein C1646_668727 [Rhizophagus diaphanus]|nr:hypothetical protein C1646_668727 [Rhizophagus diaphanus] [Rhizophagus sp. MUCL 43196]
MPKVKRQRNSYSIEQKKIVVTYTTQHGRNAASRHFEIDKTMVGCWIKASETWTNKINDKNMQVDFGRKAFYLEAEKELYNWVLEQRKKGLAVIFVTIRISMNEILDRTDMVALYDGSEDDAIYKEIDEFLREIENEREEEELEIVDMDDNDDSE